MSNTEKGKHTSKGRKAMVGTLVKYWLGKFSTPHIGKLEYENTDGEWVVRNVADNLQYVLRMDTEPSENRKAKWVFSNKKEAAAYKDDKYSFDSDLPPAYNRPARHVPPQTEKEYPVKKERVGDASKGFTGEINKAVKDLINKNDAAKKGAPTDG